MTGCGGWDPRIPPPTSRWWWSTWCPLGRSEDDADGRMSWGGAKLRSNGLKLCADRCGGAVVGRTGSRGGREEEGGACSEWCGGGTVLVVVDSSLAIVASAVERHSSRPESLSSIFVITASNPSNLFVSSSMEVVICDSNLVALRGARAQPSHVPALQPKRRDREWATAPERLTGAMRWPPPTGSRRRGVGAELGRGTGEAAALLGNETAAAGTELDWEKIWAPNREARDTRCQGTSPPERKKKQSRERNRGNRRISRIECLFCSLSSPIPYATSI